MNMFKKFAIAAGLCAAGFMGTPTAFAQSTDGFHTIQIFPVVVDTNSFTQRFTFRNPNSSSVNISMSYFPAVGTSQGVAIGCGTYSVAAGADRTFTSLRSICPALAAGSQFGYLYTYETVASNAPYSAFSRVANPQGNGFSVEAFPAHTFTSADATVIGVRRLAAGIGNPAFQTNCFVGKVVEYTAPVSPITSTITVSVTSSAGAPLGSTNVNITDGQIVRLSDIFASVGAPAGDYDNARVTFVETGDDEPGIMAFCTVQDNTSFGADFRIAKQEDGFSNGTTGFHIGAQDDHVLRDMRIASDIKTSYANAPARTFSLVTGGSKHNIHVVYFRHPDWVQCELIDPSTGVRALSTYGLEMRMLADDGTTVIAGGNDSTGWGETYLGDKSDRDNGVNSRYTIEVENNSLNNTVDIPYRLHCQSGSGSTMGDIIEWHASGEKF